MVEPRRRSGYVPARGDIVWLQFDPQAGHEQAGRRPALVVSPSAYNGRVGLALFCPLTTSIKGYPFEVAVQVGGEVAVKYLPENPDANILVLADLAAVAAPSR